MFKKAVSLYDTTLRDGTQGEGISFGLRDKLRVAERLAAFGIDYIEGGWPGSNPKDIAFFKEASTHDWGRTRIAAFGSTRRAHTNVEKDPQIRLLLDAQTPTITIFGKSWKIHVTGVLGVTPEENYAMIRESVDFLKKHDREVIYDAEHFFDGFKDDPDHALSTLQAASSADILVLCDTNGGTLPHEIFTITRTVSEKLEKPLGIHTHNDCELGVANALAAVRAGAIQIQGTMNGYGERTGNCNLTSIIPNLQLKYHIPVVEDLTRLRELSLFIDELANCPHNPRAPFVGSSAFAHKGGMHVNAVQKFAKSYEHIEPRSVGNRQNVLVSELSGQSNILLKAKDLGITLKKGSPEVLEILQTIKRLENEGYEFEAAEGTFEMLVQRVLFPREPLFEIKEYHCTFRSTGPKDSNTCEASVRVSVKGVEECTVVQSDGPVNALDTALRKALRPFYPWIDSIQLTDYKVRILGSSRGTASRTRVFIVSSDGQRDWGTVGVSDNVIEASWIALADSFEYAGFLRTKSDALTQK